MQPNSFNYCPSCGEKQFALHGAKEYRCGACNYRYFHNVAAAVSAVVVCKGELMLAKRAFDPQAGLFDFPGGFVDYDESIEEALLRELQEELQWQPDLSLVKYWFSSYNTYDFAKVQYKTSDLFFLIEIDQKPTITVQDDVEEIIWLPLAEISHQQLAFDNVVQAVEKLKSLSN